MELSKIKVAYHRNGISGIGFHVCTFTMKDGPRTHHMVGVLFEEEGACAVFDIDMLKVDNIEFAQGNSWRGDEFEPELRKAIDGCFNSYPGSNYVSEPFPECSTSCGVVKVLGAGECESVCPHKFNKDGGPK